MTHVTHHGILTRLIALGLSLVEEEGRMGFFAPHLLRVLCFDFDFDFRSFELVGL